MAIDNSSNSGGVGGLQPITTSTTATTATGPVAVEAYSVVLSVAALALAVVLGGGGGLSVLLAIFQSRRVRKYSYTLVLVFFFLCCGLDLLWAPMELAHLLTYHHTLLSPTLDFGVATFTIYVFLCAGLAILIAAFCAENVLRGCGCFGAAVRHAWPVSVCVAMFLASLLTSISFLYASLGGVRHRGADTYLVLSHESSASRIFVLTVLLVAVAIGAAGVVAARVFTVPQGDVKTSESFLSAQSNNESNSAVPSVLVNAADGVASCSGSDVDGDGGDKASISPCSSKLPDIIGPEVSPSTPVKGGGGGGKGSNNHNPGLPVPGQRGPNLLGVNMAQVLGRRRHTICQIGDSSTPPDPISKAKQYNYVRKFSVDISALQAQLENPKLFKDTAPFQSDQDLRQRQKDQETKDAKAKLTETRGPILPLPPTLKLEKGGGGGGEGGGGGGLKLTLPASRPPVITVSEDMKEDVEGEIKEEQEENEEKQKAEEVNSPHHTRTVYTPIENKAELTSVPRLPVTQPVDEEDEDEVEKEDEEKAGVVVTRPGCGEDEGEEEEDVSFKSGSHDNSHHQHHHQQHQHNHNNRLMSDSDQDFVKMTLLLALTFFLCTFPLFLVEAMKSSVNVHTYVNISTCMRALSTIQTIIYPHIVTCMDSVVSKAVSRLKARVARLCSLRDADCIDMQPDQASSSTSQL